MLSILNKVKLSGDFVSIYTNKEEPQRFSAGYVIHANKKHVLMLSVTTKGSYEGIFVFPTSDVYRIDFGGQYENRLDALYKAQHQSHPDPEIEIIDENLFMTISHYAKVNNKVIWVSFWGHEEGNLLGYIESIADELLMVQCIEDDGLDGGKSYADINSISFIACDSDAFKKQIEED